MTSHLDEDKEYVIKFEGIEFELDDLNYSILLDLQAKIIKLLKNRFSDNQTVIEYLNWEILSLKKNRS